jgi:hypothetical protein
MPQAQALSNEQKQNRGEFVLIVVPLLSSFKGFKSSKGSKRTATKARLEQQLCCG